MIRIAILGDIGAGKSFVSKQFNCPLFNADKEVAEIYKNDRSCYLKIKKAYPCQFFHNLDQFYHQD